MAAKLARQARAVCPGLSRLRALPQILIPCAIPQRLLSQMQLILADILHAIPGDARTPQFRIQLSVGRVTWKRSPMMDAVVAPSFPQFRNFHCSSLQGLKTTYAQGNGVQYQSVHHSAGLWVADAFLIGCTFLVKRF